MIYDEVQYTKNDWRNRNLIKTPAGLQWITIPCRQEKLCQKIYETKIFNRNWYKKHLNSFKVNYSKATAYTECEEMITSWYERAAMMKYLSEVNLFLLVSICEYLSIKTKISSSEIYKSGSGKNNRLVGICRDTRSETYLTGLSAQNYLDEKKFQNEGISIEYMSYKNYPVYNQLWPPFDHNVSIIDLIFNKGKDSCNFIKSE